MEHTVEVVMGTVPAVPTPETKPVAAISPWGRVTGVLFSPGKTFADIARVPSFALPLILTTVLSLIAVTTLSMHMNWAQFVRQKIDESPRASSLTAEQKDQQAETGAKVTTYIVYASGLLAPAIFALIVAVVMLGAFNLLGGAKATFMQSLGIAAHSGLVGLISTPIFVLVMFLKPKGTIDPENPVVTNVAAFLPEDSAKWLIALGKSIDIFTIWMLILVAIGFAAVNPKKLKGGAAYGIAFGVWGAWVVVRVIWAFAFS
jgi:Yip1 domain